MVCVALVLVHTRTPIYLLRPKPSRAGLEMRSMLSLIESPGLVEGRDGAEEEEEEEEEEGWSDGRRTDCLAGRRGADQFSPPAYQSCPLTLSVSADDTLSLPIGPFPGQERKSLGVCVCLQCVCVSQETEREREREREHTWGLSMCSAAAAAGFCQSFLSPRSASED